MASAADSPNLHNIQITNVPVVELNNGLKIPQLGFGVYQIPDGSESEQAVSAALDVGYRLIDTAAAYGNESSVGKAIRDSGLPREDIFVTTKLWNADQGANTTVKAFETSLEKLGLEYIDLYLIHWPMPAKELYVETWQAMENLVKDGRLKAIGVSNFNPEHLEELARHSSIVPSVNQIELHPRLQQRDIRDYCQQHGIQVESWSPIMQGGDLLDNDTLQSLGDKYGKSPAQVIIRWHLQHGLVVIPKSVHSERIKENFDVLNFALDDADMQTIDTMDTGERTGPDPANANFS